MATTRPRVLDTNLIATELSEVEIKQHQEVFNMIDKNGDGTICIDELGKAMRLTGQNPSDTEVRNIMKEEDLDGNGTLDFEEFQNLMLKRKKAVPDPDEELRAAFRVFDRDNNGYISSEELKLVMCEMGEKLSEEEFESFMEVMDINGDGCIDIEEFIHMAQVGESLHGLNNDTTEEEQ
ncbi:hypothetical protein ACF0H5_002648 [Mactra antiquata]